MKTMKDIFKRLLISSHPYISSLKETLPKVGKTLSRETLNLLLSPDVSVSIHHVSYEPVISSISEDDHGTSDSYNIV